MMGFRPVARHRSREVLLYRQGKMNLVVNAHQSRHPPAVQPTERPQIAAVALRVRDAAAAYRRALDRGAWAVPTHLEVMELNIPAIHGVGASRIDFVDRHADVSIDDVDFTRIPTVDRRPPAVAALHWFGVVQYIGCDRMDDWCTIYAELFGFAELSDEERFGILPKRRVLKSPCGTFFWQLIEPEPGIVDVEGEETLHRIGLGAPDVAAAVAALRARGMAFVESSHVHTSERGALSATQLGSVVFELVQHQPRCGDRHEPPARQPRRLRHGHDHARRAAVGQAARDSRGRLRPGGAERARLRIDAQRAVAQRVGVAVDRPRRRHGERLVAHRLGWCAVRRLDLEAEGRRLVNVVVHLAVDLIGSVHGGASGHDHPTVPALQAQGHQPPAQAAVRRVRRQPTCRRSGRSR